MLKYSISAVFFLLINTVLSQVESSQKFYYIQHFSPEGFKLVSCSPDIATHYTTVDPDIPTTIYITYYYMNGKKYMVENYDRRQLQSRKVYHPNGKKCYVEKRTMEIVGSAGTFEGNNVQLYQFPVKMISAWDSSGIRTLKDGEGKVYEHDVLGKLRQVKSYKNQRIYTIVYQSIAYYPNTKIMFEENNGNLKYALAENGDTLITKGTGQLVSKYTNDSVYAEFKWMNGKLFWPVQYYFPNGKVQNDILPDDKFIYYYSNGQIRLSGEWQKGNRFGEWKWFDRKGKLLEQRTFESFELFRDARF